MLLNIYNIVFSNSNVKQETFGALYNLGSSVLFLPLPKVSLHVFKYTPPPQYELPESQLALSLSYTRMGKYAKAMR